MSDGARLAQLRPASPPAARFLVLRSADLRAGEEAAVRRRPQLRRPRADGAERRRLPHARLDGPRARCWCATRAASSCCRTSAATGKSIMLEGRGNAQNIVCPLHRWTYDLKGELLGAPHFAESPCVKLRSTPLTQLERPAVRRAARPARRTSRGITTRGRLGLLRLRARLGARRRVRRQLEDLHRDLSRGLPRRSLPSGAGQLHRLQQLHGRLRVGLLGADRRRRRPASGSPARPSTASWHDACLKFLDGAHAEAGRAVDDLLPRA